MDVEKTMEFLLDQAARADARMGRADARMDRAEARSDREFEKIRKLFQVGARELAEQRRQQREVKAELRRLAEAQTRTEKALALFLRSLGRGGGNGHRR